MAYGVIVEEGIVPFEPCISKSPPLPDDDQSGFDGEYVDVDRRQYDIEKMTEKYILGLMDLQDDELSIVDLGISDNDLKLIIDEFEAILFGYGITICHPDVIVDSTGNERVVNSIYADDY